MRCCRVSRTGRLEPLLPPCLRPPLIPPGAARPETPAELPLVLREEYAQRIGEPVHQSRASARHGTDQGAEEALPHGDAPPAEPVADASKTSLLLSGVSRSESGCRVTVRSITSARPRAPMAAAVTKKLRHRSDPSKAERSGASNGSRPLVPSSRPNAAAASPFSIASELSSATITRANSPIATNPKGLRSRPTRGAPMRSAEANTSTPTRPPIAETAKAAPSVWAACPLRANWFPSRNVT